MQFMIEDAMKPRTLKESAISVPNSIYMSKVLGKDIEVNAGYYEDRVHKNALKEMWSKQHPLIHTWLVLSSISICFLSALLYFL